MKSMKFRYLKLAGWSVGLSLAVAYGAHLSTAIGSSSFPTTVNDADLSSEARTLDTFVNDLFRFHKQIRETNKKTSLAQTEFQSLQRNGDDLKHRLSGVRDAICQIKTKLKAAGQWDDLDAIVLTRITDAKLQADFRQRSFKQNLEETCSQLNDDSNEISGPLDALRGKLSSRETSMVRDSARLSAHAVLKLYQGLGCRLAALRVGVSGFLGGKSGATTAARDNYDCACTGITTTGNACP